MQANFPDMNFASLQLLLGTGQGQGLGVGSEMGY